jgi:hypothetical protein
MKERQKKVRSMSEALGTVLGTPEAALELAIARLWRHWPEILGPEIAAMIRPLGHRQSTMLLGATNSMVMQEFSFFAQDILEKANAFLGNAYFQKVQIELMAGRPALDQSLLPPIPPRPQAPRPDILGNLLPCMDPSSPVTSCYRAYVRHFYPELEIPENE